MNNRNDIFGSFTPLSSAQIKGNVKYVSLWVIPFLIITASVVVAVNTGFVWIAAMSGVIGVGSLIFVAGIQNVRYVPQFGFKYNLLRALMCGGLVYAGVAWRGLLGFYNFFYNVDGWNFSASTFGWVVMTLSLVITLISKYILCRIVSVQIADLIGIIEMTACATFIGSIMFMLLYT